MKTDEVRIKWLRPPEDPAIGAIIENIRMWNDEIGVNKLIQPNITEITFKVNPDSEYSFNFQTIYENGLRSLIQVIEFKSAPEILEPTIFKRTDVSGNFQF